MFTLPDAIIKFPFSLISTSSASIIMSFANNLLKYKKNIKKNDNTKNLLNLFFIYIYNSYHTS